MSNFLFDWVQRFVSPNKAERLNLGRRGLLLAGGAGIGINLLGRVSPQGEGQNFSPTLIRPPGSVPESEFLEKCAIRLGILLSSDPFELIDVRHFCF